MKNVMIRNAQNGGMGSMAVTILNYFTKCMEDLGYKVDVFEPGTVPFEVLHKGKHLLVHALLQNSRLNENLTDIH